MTMIQQSSQSTVPNWLKWLLLIVMVIGLISCAFIIWMYVHIENDKTSQFDQASKIAIQQTDLASVENVELYNGAQTVHIVHGSTSQSQGLTVLVNVKNKNILASVTDKERISKAQLKKEWMNSCSSCTFKDIRMGYEEEQAVYELTFIDDKNRYVFDYYLPNGEKFQQRFAFKQSN